MSSIEKEASVDAELVEVVLAAARLLVGISAQSVAAIDDVVTLPQLRVLMMVDNHGPLNLSAVAAGLGVHRSNGTRVVDRLVNAGLLDRRDDPADRRNLVLELTPAGRELVDTIVSHRREAVVDLLRRMPQEQRAALGPALSSFAAAGGEVGGDPAWSLGWSSG
ncbi:MarR family winged helix-turn-helix transcriptional regulator [Pseudonocardia parietis]|uniref:DNA-binding MarR family transcriptional regulator n=1 Tax=Pseudonocardia parietis TaxID=570936 RepID=A0ABS4VR57_9PSEU|nr:MarR family transcriptional regulator [Pseudonocardia parietis]MBP2366251.1 DNA-binding MarR family transcriptional regulator [Pseudonocardia parietis]